MLKIDAFTSNKLEEDYYKILGCSETSTQSQIATEFRLRALKYHPDKNPNDSEALDKFKKLQEAKDVLTDHEKRYTYDKWKNSELNISFKKWKNLGKRCHTTMHWGRPKTQTMLEGARENDTNSACSSAKEYFQFGENIKLIHASSLGESESSHIYGKFRRYEI